MPATSVQSYGFRARDGVRLAYHTVGSGRPLLLLHGYFSSAYTNWIRYGHAALLAARGYEVVMADLRAHGESAKPHSPASYPPDVLTSDALSLVEHLGWTEYDLGGYSLGGRTVLRMLVCGATPRAAVVGGTGLGDLTSASSRGSYFRHILTNLGTFSRGSAEWHAEAFLRTTGGDPSALLLLLDSWVDTPVAALRSLLTPVAVVVGDGDERVEGARELADVLPVSTYAVVPGTHMSTVTKPELGQAYADALARSAG